MKRFAVVCALLSLFAFTGLKVNAEEKMSEEALNALESQLFATYDTMDVSSDAKFASELENLEGNDGVAKCWFWCYRPAYYYYPSYYYYTWYCPVYYVPLRIVSYAIPATTVVTTPAVTTDTTVTTQATTTTVDSSLYVSKFLPSSKHVAKGAVIDAKVPANSPLRKIGLRSGDIITSVDGNPVNTILDVRRIKADSQITYVRGNQIKVANKPILQRMNDQRATAMKSNDLTVESVKDLQGTQMSLYEYYDKMEAENK